MPVARSTSTEEMVETRSLPNDFDGVITKVSVAPLDWGKMWSGKWNSEWTPPFCLGFYLHFQPDEGEEFIQAVDATGWGKLQWYISATVKILNDPECLVSDIEYPGSPQHPDGLDMGLMEEEMQEVWDASGGEISVYHQMLIEKWGGLVAFSIGRDIGLPKRPQTNWSFWMLQLEKLENHNEVAKARFGVRPNSNPPVIDTHYPQQLLEGFRGHYERVEVPQRIKKKGAMQSDDSKSSRPFELLVPTRFDEYVDVANLDKPASVASTATGDGATTEPSSSTPSTGNAEDKFREALTDAIVESSNERITSVEIRAIAMDKSRWTGDERKTVVKLRNNPEFLGSVGTWDAEKGMLTL